MNHIIRDDPEVGLDLALEIIARGPLHGFTSFDTFSPLRELLRLHGPEVIDTIEATAADSVLVRRCLWRAARQQSHPLQEWDIPAEVWARAERAIAGTTDFNTDDPAGVARSLPLEYERVVAAWFVYEDTFWAWDRVRELVEQDPEPAWRVITLLVDGAHSDEMLGSVAAGPLEHFLSAHGEFFIERIEVRARRDERFRRCLAGVWPSDMPVEIWDRVRAAAEAVDLE